MGEVMTDIEVLRRQQDKHEEAAVTHHGAGPDVRRRSGLPRSAWGILSASESWASAPIELGQDDVAAAYQRLLAEVESFLLAYAVAHRHTAALLGQAAEEYRRSEGNAVSEVRAVD
jgi:hypothetical protein